MEPSIATPAAPAPPAAPAVDPTTLSAAHAAVAAGDTKGYREARRAERAHKPLPTVAVAAAASAPSAEGAADPAAPVPPAEPKLSRKEREQQETNERVRTAVDRATADLRAEIAQLRGAAPSSVPRPAASAPPEAPPQAKFPTLEQWSAANPEKSFDDFLEARDEHREQQRTAAAQTRATADELSAAQQQRIEAFTKQLHDTRAADPDFVSKLTPDVLALKPFSGLKPGEQGGPANILAEQIYDSPIAPKVLLYLSQHPEELARFTTVPPEIAAKPVALRTGAHIQYIVREFGKLEGRLAVAAPAAAAAPAVPEPKTLTDAPAAPAALGSRATEATDPKVAAIRSNDTRAYRQLRREERAAARR
jgi:hypothetical protein